MKVFWKKKNDTILTWQLLIEPAALLLTITRRERGWWLKCLGQECLFADKSCTIENAQSYAVQWLSNELFAIQKVLDRGIPSQDNS